MTLSPLWLFLNVLERRIGDVLDYGRKKADQRFDQRPSRIPSCNFRATANSGSLPCARVSSKPDPKQKAVRRRTAQSHGPPSYNVRKLAACAAYRHPQQLIAWLGVTPSEHSSGDQWCQGSITKNGNSYGRKPLVGAARSYRYLAHVSPDIQRRHEVIPRSSR